MFFFQTQPRIRPACSSDAEAMARFIDALEPRSRCLRFHGGIGHCPLALAQRLTASDPGINCVRVASVRCDEGERIVAEARWVVADVFGLRAELAICVADAWQGSGLADRLMAELVAMAARAQIAFLEAEVLAGNGRMLAFLQRHGFDADPYGDAGEAGDGVVRLFRYVGRSAAAPRAGLWQRLRGAGAQGMSTLSSRSAAAASSRSPRSSRAATAAAPSASLAAR